jgi:hypothetical protein
MTSNRRHQSIYRSHLIAVLCLALTGVPQLAAGQVAAVPPLATAQPVLPAGQTPGSMEQAKLTIQVAEARIIGDFSTTEDEKSFLELINANARIGFIDDAPAFTEFWKQNKAEILRAPPTVGAKPLNWQMFLAQTYTSYKIQKTKAHLNPSGLMQWMNGVVNNPWVNWASVGTAVAVMYSLNFVTGILKGAMIAGPAAGAVNSGINPIMTPVNQKLTIIGNKYFGPTGMKLNALFFDTKEMKASEESAKSKEAINGLRHLIEGRSYDISSENWRTNMKALQKHWNKINFLWGLLPDAYKGGRSIMADLTIRSTRDFAQATTNSINASEVQRQGAESILDRMIAKGANALAVEDAGQKLVETIKDQTKIDREHPERSKENQPRIESGKADLIRLGASPEQAERFVENYRKAYVFERQAAAMLVGQVIHDAMYSDTIKGAESVYNEFLKNQSLNYMHGQLKEAVVEILQRMEFKVQIATGVAALTQIAAEKAKESALDKVQKITGTEASARSLNESGSVVKEEPRTAAERAKEAAARAGRK